MASFVDANGQRQQVDLCEKGPMYHYDMAQREGVSLRQWLNSQYATEPGKPDAFSQMCVAAGLRFRKNEETGTPAANLREILNPMAATNQTGGTHINYPQIPDSRLLFPAAVMEAVNAALDTKENEAMGAFAQLIAYTDTIASDRWEQPVITLSGKGGPEEAAWRRTAQNAPPPLMLGITAADVTRTIPTKSIGLTISDKALRFNSLDMIARTLTHFYKKADFAEWVIWLLLILNGDSDATNVPMATAKSALSQTRAVTYDSAVVAAGTITQLAWLKWHYANTMSMTKTHIVTDWAAANAVDGRTNRPTNVQDNSTDRLDRQMRIIYPNNAQPVDVLVMPAEASWPANTLMGLDKSQAIGRVISSTADYEATENLVMLRSTNYRFDRGSLLYRLYDAAFDVLSLTLPG